MPRRYRIPQFSIEDVLRYKGVTQFKSAPSGAYCKCPYHDHNERAMGDMRIYTDEKHGFGAFVCSRDSGGTVWDMLERYEHLPGWDARDDEAFDETLLWVYRAIGREPEEIAEYTPTPVDRARDLLRDIEKELVPIRFDSPNDHYTFEPRTQSWLYRGHPPLLWYSRGVGMLTEAALDDLRYRYGVNVFKAAGIKPWGEKGFLGWLCQGVVIMRKNEYGSPVGLGVRRYPELVGRSGEVKPKYVKNTGSPLMDYQSYVYGLKACRAAVEEGAPVVYCTEGEFDCEAMQIGGLPNTVATGAGTDSGAQLEIIRSLGDVDVVFVLDNDENGSGFRNAVRIAEKHGDVLFVILPNPGDDPDTFVQRSGTGALQALPRYTALQIQMLGEPAFDPATGTWSVEKDGLAGKYLKRVIGNPTAYDEKNVRMIAKLAGRDEAYYRSWLFRERNLQSVADIDVPVRART